MKTESLEAISERGDELETLRALRRKVSNTLDKTASARDIAALSRQLQQLVLRIRELEDLTDTSAEGREIAAIIASKRQVRSGRRPEESQDEEETAEEC